MAPKDVNPWSLFMYCHKKQKRLCRCNQVKEIILDYPDESTVITMVFKRWRLRHSWPLRNPVQASLSVTFFSIVNLSVTSTHHSRFKRTCLWNTFDFLCVWTPLPPATPISSYMEKEMATHSSILAWKIPWMEEPGGLQSMQVTKSCTGLKQFSRHTPVTAAIS